MSIGYPRIIRNFNAFVDGVSYAGLVRDGKVPDPKIMTAAHRGAGMGGPVGVDMGLEAMKAELNFAEWNQTILAMLGTIQRFVFRPAGKSDEGIDQKIIYTCRGLITAPEFGGLKGGDESLLKIVMDVRALRLEQDDVVIWDIDLETGKRVIGGIDQTATMRANMGL